MSANAPQAAKTVQYMRRRKSSSTPVPSKKKEPPPQPPEPSPDLTYWGRVDAEVRGATALSYTIVVVSVVVHFRGTVLVSRVVHRHKRRDAVTPETNIGRRTAPRAEYTLGV